MRDPGGGGSRPGVRRAAGGTFPVCAGILGLAGCGLSAPSSGLMSSTATATTTVGSPTPDRACRSDQLSVAAGQGGVALGHVAEGHVFTNTSAHACSLVGYPGIQLLDANKQPMPIHVEQSTGAYTFTDQQARTVTLSPGGAAYFKLEWTDEPQSGQTCPRASYVRVMPPGGSTSFDLTENVQPCDSVITSPVEPSSF